MKRCHYCGTESDDLVEELIRSCTDHDVWVMSCKNIPACIDRVYEQHYQWEKQNEINRRAMDLACEHK